MGFTGCENCGCRVYNGACTNCHEESYTEEQYYYGNEQIQSGWLDNEEKNITKQKEVQNDTLGKV